jgi:hypothetical protein
MATLPRSPFSGVWDARGPSTGRRQRGQGDRLTFATEFCNATEHQAPGRWELLGCILRVLFATLKSAVSGPSADVAKLTGFETHREPDTTNWSLNYRINDDTGGSRQRLHSCLCAVHLEDVCGDVHCGVIIYVLELEVGVADGYLKPSYELGHGFLAPTVEKSFASQWRNIVWISDEFLIGVG